MTTYIHPHRFDRFALLILTLCLTHNPSFADDPAEKPPALGDLRLGTGLAVTINGWGKDRIKDASLDANGVVRINQDNNHTPRLLLETHYLFVHEGPIRRIIENTAKALTAAPSNTPSTPTTRTWGHGPFVCVQPGDDIIDGAGAGWMIGWKRPEGSSFGQSFNIGLGYLLDRNVKVLGDGLAPNQKLPAGETEIRYRETSAGSLVLMFSVTF